MKVGGARQQVWPEHELKKKWCKAVSLRYVYISLIYVTSCPLAAELWCNWQNKWPLVTFQHFKNPCQGVSDCWGSEDGYFPYDTVLSPCVRSEYYITAGYVTSRSRDFQMHATVTLQFIGWNLLFLNVLLWKFLYATSWKQTIFRIILFKRQKIRATGPLSVLSPPKAPISINLRWISEYMKFILITLAFSIQFSLFVSQESPMCVVTACNQDFNVNFICGIHFTVHNRSCFFSVRNADRSWCETVAGKLPLYSNGMAQIFRCVDCRPRNLFFASIPK